MAVSRALRRLLRIRNLEEEQCRLALESARGDLNRLEQALAATHERDRRGRSLVGASLYNGQLTDRLAGLEETKTAARFVKVLTPRIAAAESRVATLRQEFLAKRVERRQAETLIEETEARDAIEASRRAQQSLDDWYGNGLHRKLAGDNRPESAEMRPSVPGPATQIEGRAADET
jgi:flagellar biosynthesis chaperone FliJ